MNDQRLDAVLAEVRTLIASPHLRLLDDVRLVTPERKWFPDPWTPTLDSVQRVLCRLALYAGLPPTPIHVVYMDDLETLSDDSPRSNERLRHAIACYYGREGDTLWFGVRQSVFGRPKQILGVLAHEMAHAWRDIHGIHAEAHAEEERLTDATTIALGMGILSCNSAYAYESSGGLRETRWSHSSAGYLSPAEMCALLAVWSASKLISEDSIRRHLEVTQRNFFVSFRSALQTREQLAALELGMAAAPLAHLNEVPHSLPFPIGAWAETVQSCLHLTRLASTPDRGAVPFKSFPLSSSHVPMLVVAEWGGAKCNPFWRRRLLLVPDREETGALLILEAATVDQAEQLILGALPIEAMLDMEIAARWLVDMLIRATADYQPVLFPRLPTAVRIPARRRWRSGDGRSLFLMGWDLASDEARDAVLAGCRSEHQELLGGVFGLAQRLARAITSDSPEARAREWWTLTRNGLYLPDHFVRLGLADKV